MSAGIARTGDSVALRSSLTHRNRCEFDIAIFYGLAGGLAKLMRDYRDSGRRAIYCDLGYWGRRKRSRWDGFHKMALNSRHPTAYFQSRKHSPDRFKVHGVTIRPWRREGNHVLVIGMSGKAAGAENFAPQQWERDTIKELSSLTDRPIIYRPKPNWPDARPISGSIFGKGPSLEEALVGCHAVVTHHSNAAVEALLAGVPCICPDGAASVLSSHELADIENPLMPRGRDQFAADLAWTQWSVEEMENGGAYRYLIEEGLLG